MHAPGLVVNIYPSALQGASSEPRVGARKWALPRSYWIRLQHPVSGFPRINALGSSVNRGNPLPNMDMAVQALDRCATSGHGSSRRGSGSELRPVCRAPGVEGASGATGYLRSEGGDALKRVLLVLTVAALMVAILVASVMPAFADTERSYGACHSKHDAFGLPHSEFNAQTQPASSQGNQGDIPYFCTKQP